MQLPNSQSNLFITQQQHKSHFRIRNKRDNTGMFEEINQNPNLERECIEQSCEIAEANEYFVWSQKNQPDKYQIEIQQLYDVEKASFYRLNGKRLGLRRLRHKF